MRNKLQCFFRDARGAWAARDFQVMMLFALEGLLLQFATSVKAFGNNLFATNLGATDTQIGLIQTVGCAVTVALLVPVGVLSDRSRNAKTVPMALLLLGGVMFVLESLVPWMGGGRMALFFVFMGLSVGLFGAYGGQWQSMFGDLVPIQKRNRIYALRSRLMAALGIFVPVFCGVAMSLQDSAQGKLGVLSVFFLLSGLLMIAEAFVVWKIPGGRRTPEQMQAMERFSLKNLGEALLGAVKNRKFMSFVAVSMFLYLGWHLDWSLWYIAQVKYALLSEAQLSYFNAICSILQVFSLGVFARLNQKKSVHFTVCVGAFGLSLYPAYIQIIFSVPAAVRPWTFIGLCVTANMLEACLAMCLVQMLLEVVPERHRSLTVSLYTVLTTLSNCIMPLVGVRIYVALGSDLRAMRIFFLLEGVLRISAFVVLALRYRRMKRSGNLVNPLATE